MANEGVTGSQVDEANVATAEEAEDEDSPAAFQKRLKEAIRVNVADAGVLRKKLTVTIPAETIQEELDKQYGELISDAIVPGFRKGRAPRRLVEKRFGQEVGQQVQTKLVSNAYMAAVEKQDLKVLGDPLVWARPKKKRGEEGADAAAEELVDMPTGLEHMKLPESGDFEFRCEVEVKPEFEMPKLEGIPVERPRLTITDEDVTAQIDRVRANRGTWTPVLEGKVEPDDMLVCDMRITVGGEEVKSAENVPIAARPQRIAGVAFEDLGEVLTGAQVGDRKTLTGTLPDDYPREDVRGKEAEFELTIQDIKRLELPPLDAEYLQNAGFDTEDEYRAWMKEQMSGRLEHEIKQGMRGQVCKYLLHQTGLGLPEGLSSRTTDRAVLRRAVELRRRGVPLAEIEKHADELRTSARDETINELKLHFILERIAEDLKVEVTEEEINAQIAVMARAYDRRFDRVRDELARDNGIESLYLQIRDEKCIDRLLEQAAITDVEPDTPAAKTGKKAGSKAKKTAKKAGGKAKPAGEGE